MSECSNYKIIKQMVQKHQHELVLSYNKVVKLEGFEDGEEDYYYILSDYREGITFDSCVGNFHPLKNVIDGRYYETLMSMYYLNARVHLVLTPEKFKKERIECREKILSPQESYKREYANYRMCKSRCNKCGSPHIETTTETIEWDHDSIMMSDDFVNTYGCTVCSNSGPIHSLI